MLHISWALTAYCVSVTAIFGLILGSFLNCMAWRMVHGESVARGRSHCAHCGHTLGALELIPVVSWAVQKGRCRHCGQSISIRYPLTELLTALAMVALLLRYDVSLQLAQLAGLCAILLVISLVDLSTGMIPNGLLVAGIVNFLLYLPFGQEPLTRLGWALVDGLSVSLPLLLLSLVMDRVLGRESMGGGDIKLFFVIGLYFPWTYNLLTLLLSCILGIAFAYFCNIRTPDSPSAFPFGPAIATAAFLSMLVAKPLVDWYLGFF